MSIHQKGATSTRKTPDNINHFMNVGTWFEEGTYQGRSVYSRRHNRIAVFMRSTEDLRTGDKQRTASFQRF